MASGRGEPERLLARKLPRRHPSLQLDQLPLRWTIELDYKQLKGELGLDHYEGRSWLGGITTPRWSPPPTDSSRSSAPPFSPAAGLTLEKAVLLLQPLFKCWTGRCQTCDRRINIDRLTLTLDRHNE